MPIISVAKSHVGRVRKNNEDSYYTAPLPEAEHCTLALVSDGVGGKKYGEVASAKTKQVFADLIVERKLQAAIDLSLRCAMLDMSARRAHQDIAAMSQENKDYTGMACTLVCVLADSQQVGWVNVGDSRLYHYSNDELTQVSEDQTVAMALLKENRIKPEALANHPDKNTLMYCLGVEAVNHPIAPDTGLISWQQDDKILLCSDGLSDMVDDALIKQCLDKSVQEALDLLLKAALDAGGKDNITAVILENQEDMPC